MPPRSRGTTAPRAAARRPARPPATRSPTLLAPGERHPAAGQKVPEIMAAGIVALPDDRRHGGGRFGGDLLEALHPFGHRPGHLRAQHPALGDHLQEIGGLEPQQPGGLGGLEARQRRRAEQQRYLAEVRAGLVGPEPLVPPSHQLVDIDPALEQAEEGGRLAFDEEIFVRSKPDVRRALRQGSALARRQRGEQGDAREQVGCDHTASSFRWRSSGRLNDTRVSGGSTGGPGRRTARARIREQESECGRPPAVLDCSG